MLQAQIYIDKNDIKGTQPLYEFIFQFLLKYKIAGATAFRGQMGFGASQQIKQPDELFSFDEPPMLITFIDEDEKVKNVLIELRKQVKDGLIITNQVEKWD